MFNGKHIHRLVLLIAVKPGNFEKCSGVHFSREKKVVLDATIAASKNGVPINPYLLTH